LIIITPTLRITDEAGVFVRSLGSGDGGNLEIRADRLSLDQAGVITAETESGEGGNIELQIQETLFLRNNSQITANAHGNGNGGNINIGADFILAVPQENSDITANAFEGRGGNVQITTQGILGIEPRTALTLQSDITASSEFGIDGAIVIDSPEIDPIQGTATLPTALSAPPLAQGCYTSSRQNRFVVVGRGGIPSSPVDTLTGDLLWQDLSDPLEEIEGQSWQRRHQGIGEIQQNRPDSGTIIAPIEAEGWVVQADGTIALVAASRPQQINVTGNLGSC
jgi:large exoprotein involved in heme utilization and adhesion